MFFTFLMFFISACGRDTLDNINGCVSKNHEPASLSEDDITPEDNKYQTNYFSLYEHDTREPNDTYVQIFECKVADDILSIPYFGNNEYFRLPMEHTLAYVEAIRNAELDLGDWGHFYFDVFYPVFIDISGDGIPLLLLIDKADEADTWSNLPLHVPLLFGFADGELQKIAYFSAIGIVSDENEELLSVGWVTDFGGSYDLYRVNNGAAEFVSTLTFVADWHGGDPHGEISIDGEEVSPDEYWTILENIPTKLIIEKWHPGNTVVPSIFKEYLSQSYTREQVIGYF